MLARTGATTALVFTFFQLLPHVPVGVSEVHLILGSQHCSSCSGRPPRLLNWSTLRMPPRQLLLRLDRLAALSEDVVARGINVGRHRRPRDNLLLAVNRDGQRLLVSGGRIKHRLSA